MAFSPDGTEVAAGADWGAEMWNVKTGSVIAKLGGGDRNVGAIVWSADGKTIAALGSSQ